MRTWQPSLLVIATITFARLGAAGADEQIIAAQDRPRLTVETQLGIAMPLGVVGVAADVSLNDRFAISAGIGAGASGPQVALMGRYRWQVNDWSVTAGGGVSGGKYEWTELVFDDPAEKKWDLAIWGNAEVGLERSFGDGYHVRLFAGVGTILNRDAGVCVGSAITHCQQDHQGDGFTMPYVGLAIGWGWLL